MRALLEYVQALLDPLHRAMCEGWHGGVYCHAAFIMGAFNFMSSCQQGLKGGPSTETATLVALLQRILTGAYRPTPVSPATDKKNAGCVCTESTVFGRLPFT